MYANVKRLYHEGRLNDYGLERAVTLGWITEEQYYEIYETAPHNQQPEEPEQEPEPVEPTPEPEQPEEGQE